jgi:predicted RNase H-like HicB family nuclease
MSKNNFVRDYLKKPYARILLPDDNGGYAAEILEFPGCYACGDTPGEAIENLENAALSWIEAALKQNQEIPEPLANYGYSGKINLRLPKSIHKLAARFAQRDDISLNQFFTSAISAKVGAEELYDRLVQKFENRFITAAYTVLSFQNIMYYNEEKQTCCNDYNLIPEQVPVNFIPQEVQRVKINA